MELRKIIGIVFLAVSLIPFGILITRTEFSIQLCRRTARRWV